MRLLLLFAFVASAGCSPEFWRAFDDAADCEPTNETRAFEYETCSEGECTTREATQHRFECPDGSVLWI
jgi:hypothetical protein